MDHIRDAIKEYGEVYKSLFYSGVVIWRPLTKQEFFSLKDLAEQKAYSILDQEEFVWDSCVVYTDIPDEDLRAGTVTTVVKQIFHFTGFWPSEIVLKGTLNGHRQAVQGDPVSTAITFICSYLNYTPDDLEGKTFSALMKLVAYAELASGRVYNYGDEEEGEPSQKAPHYYIDRDGQPQRVDLRGQGGIDSRPTNKALAQAGVVRTIDPRFEGRAYGQNAQIFAQIPLLDAKDLRPEASYVETARDNARMHYDNMPFTEEYRRDVLGQEW